MKIFSLKKLFFCCFCVFFMSVQAFAQDNINVSGTVTDAKTGETLIGVSIVPQGIADKATTTNYDGKYSITNLPKGTTLVISYVGYTSAQVVANSTSVDVKLSVSEKLLDEVVVIGYGTVKRKDVTTAVSTVSAEDLDLRPITSAGQAIQGKAAGVTVVQPSGTPGGDLAIRVRGTTSFNGSNDPLYVVDGVPVDNIKFLSPNDIESMQILKDASSAAIYGSRAANGVVIITTKAGTKGNSKITFSSQLTLRNVSEKIKPLNYEQYKELQDEIGMINLPDGLTDQTNWFDEAYSTGVTQNYQVSISDGTDKLRYFLSGGYLDEKGVLETAYYKRYNFRASIDNQVRKWLNVSANVSYSDYTLNGVSEGTGANRGGVVLSVINTPTYAPIWNPDNTAQYYNNFYGVGNITNPLENMARSENNKNKENRLIATGSALITFVPELNLKSSFTIDRRNAISTTFVDPISTAYGRDNYGVGSDSRNMNTVLTFDNILTYTKKWGKHGVEAMGGTSWTSSDYTNNWINGSHYRDGSIQTLNAANKISWSNTGSSASQWEIMSYLARVAYNYDSKYLLTGNMRLDGSSRLHPDSRWGVFPSFSGAWRMSAEDFMKDLTWLDDLKIRAGWGQTGNQSGLSDYAYMAMYSINRIAWFETGKENSVPSVTQSSLPATDLTWETTTQTNIGVDFTAFRSKLNIALDYYYKKTTDMLMDVNVPAGAAPATSIRRNEGEMMNKGFEAMIGTNGIKLGSLSWDANFNISFNKNELTKLALKQVYYDGRTSDYVDQQVVRNTVGRSLGGFYGYISDGVDPETGELMYRDINDDSKITSADRTYIGDPNPDFTFGFTNSFTWKDLTLSIFLQGSYGNDIYNASRMETEGMYDGKNQSTAVLDRWKIPGQITDVPKAGFVMYNSTYFVEDGSYLRVKDLTLSYNLRASALKKIGINRLQPYFTASNLLTFTKYNGMDPEVNQWGNSGAVQGIDWGTYPHSKSFVFGVNLEF